MVSMASRGANDFVVSEQIYFGVFGYLCVLVC